MELLSRLTAITLLVLLLPILLLIGIVSLVLQGRPIIFRQERVGKDFENFIIFKFRTIKNFSSNKLFSDGGGIHQATRWGRFLRKTKLDELPQLMNVIKGDMRFIGPRPEIPEYVDSNTFSFLNDIKPGLSGFSSILFRNESEVVSMIDSKDPYKTILKIKVCLDNYYVNKKGFYQDLKLVGITIVSLFLPKKTGHYMLLKLLNIQDADYQIRDLVNKVKIKKIKNNKFRENSSSNYRILILSDIISVLSAFMLALFIKYDFKLPTLLLDSKIYNILGALIGIKLSFFYFFDLYKGMWRYTSILDMLNIAKANISGTAISILLIPSLLNGQNILLSTFIIDFMLSFGFVSLSRLGIRLVYSHLINPRPYKIEFSKRVILIGSDSNGQFICKELLNDSKHLMDPVGFLDDNKKYQGRMIHGIPVLGKVSDLNDYVNEYDEALICCPNVPRKQLHRIIEICKTAGKPYRTIPSIEEVVSGKLTLNQIKEVSIIDLLGRNEVTLNEGLIKDYITGKRILITGAGGSIGSELVRQCIKFEPALLVMLDNSEYNLFQIEREILEKRSSVLTKPLLTNVRDIDIMSKVFTEYEPQIIFHAAAYKHVSMQEAFPWEAVETNVHGTTNLVNLSLKHNIEKFVLVSTDKAVKPINVMGATKRLAELICQAADEDCSTSFMAVRFGNVLGSSGSVIPIFQEQIKAGGPITITDPDMERYFMSITEAAQLILQSGGIGKGGEIFALDMGRPIKILDIANDLIKLSGLEPDIDIPISFIGTRQGEKKNEELVLDSESFHKTVHEKIYEIRSSISKETRENIILKINEGELIGHGFNNFELRSKLESLVPEYKSLDKDKKDPIVLKVVPEIQA